MKSELPKAYDPSAVENEASRVWNEIGAFHAEPTDPGNPYSIVIPPPNVTAALHLGHALNNTLQDILTRVHRMMGDNTCWLPGTDHAGIATQTVVDKRLQSEGRPALKDYKKQETEGKNGREQFIEKVQAWKDEYEARITSQLKAMGCSCDWDRQAFTMDEQRAKAVREAFFQLFKDGLIYRGKRLVNWDPVTQTALADDEVEMEEIDGFFYYLKYPLTDGSGHVTVATTRPETMLGDTAVGVNPKDPRAAGLKGKKVLLPIVNREIPIIEDDYVVLPVSLGGNKDDVKAQFATGFLKVTPAHDPNDYDLGIRHSLPMINVMAPDASISDKHGWTDIGDASFLLGKSREEARKLVVDWFKQNGLLEEIKPYRHSVGHSYRSHVPIEPWLSDQWYCRVTDDRLRGAARCAMATSQHDANSDTGFQPVQTTSAKAQSPSHESPQHGLKTRATGEWQGALRFYPARYAKTFQSWHENIRDWCISRQLWWGHRIPVWSHIYMDFELDDLKEDFSPIQSVDPHSLQVNINPEFKLNVAVRLERLPSHQVVAYITLAPNAEKLEAKLRDLGFGQDPDVLDTWFSSGLWPLSTLDWPNDSALSTPNSALNIWNPTSVLCTAREIITLWVSRMVMFNLYFLNRLPFNDVFIHAMIQDGHGQKMSKSLGNGVDPMDIIHSHGADAMRFTLASMATNTQDVRLPVDMVDPHSGEMFTPKYITDSAGYTVAAPIQESPKDPKKKLVSSYGVASGKAQATKEMPAARNTSSKFDLGRNFCNKLWNASRFVMMNLENAKPTESIPWDLKDASLADRWILSKFARAVKDAEIGLGDYRFDQYAKSSYDFFWRDYCDWYVEASKAAMKDPQRAPQTARVLAGVLDGALRLMHPIIPFITETVWWKLNEIPGERDLPGLKSGVGNPHLVKAPWPRPDASLLSDADEAAFTKLQEIIIAIRNVRNEYKVDPKKPVTVSINAPEEMPALILENQALVELLATCALKQVKSGLTSPANATRTTAAGCEIFLENLVDAEAEKQRSAKRREELTKQINAMKGRLSNQGYIAKAPPELVKQTQDQLAAAEAELAKLG